MSDEVLRRLSELGGAVRRRDIAGVVGGARAIDRAAASGTIDRLGRGIYALPGCSHEAVAAVTHGALIGCVSAIQRAGIAVLNAPDRPHLSVPRARGSSPSRLRDDAPATLHRESWVSGGHRPGVVVAPAPRALARMLVCCNADEAVVSIDSALQQRLTSVDAIRSLLPPTADVRARSVLALADGRSRSPLETMARLSLRAAGLRVEAGVMVPMVGEVDLVVEGRVVVELDGFAYHGGRREFDEDRRRDRELALQGYVVLRFTARDVLRDRDRLVATVLAALGAPRRANGVRI